MSDTAAKAAELIRLRRAVDAGGGAVDLKAHHKWSRHSYLYSEEIAQALLTAEEQAQKDDQAHTETIEERDTLTEFVAGLYREITGQPCEWSNKFGLPQIREQIVDQLEIARSQARASASVGEANTTTKELTDG